MPQKSFLIRLSADQLNLLSSAALSGALNLKTLKAEEQAELIALHEMLDPVNDLFEGRNVGDV